MDNMINIYSITIVPKFFGLILRFRKEREDIEDIVVERFSLNISHNNDSRLLCTVYLFFRCYTVVNVMKLFAVNSLEFFRINQ